MIVSFSHIRALSLKWTRAILYWVTFVSVVFILFAFSNKTYAADELEADYDEISVFVQLPRVGGLEIPAIIRDNEPYLAVTNLFRFLKIKNTPSDDLDLVSGFFINPDAPYLIDKTKNQITYQKKIFELKAGDLIRTESNLYLKSAWLNEIFGLECVFNFRSLSITLNCKQELPVIRELKQELMRRNISTLKNEQKADSTIARRFPLFKLGFADWSVMSIQRLQGFQSTRLNLALGSLLFGGEANVALNYIDKASLRLKNQQYLWRYVDNQQQGLRQVLVGKIPSQATASLLAPVIGVQVTNTPTTYRRSFGTYRISDYTEPGWTVELYVNNVLVDYVKADASGFYRFEAPLVYGNSAITLRFYSQWGEERSTQQTISIPFNFLPKNEFQYTVSAGLVEDSLYSKYSRANINYGLHRRLTVGAGLEYFSALHQNTMPFVNASMNLFSNLLFFGEYTYGVRSKGVLTYRRPSNLQFELNYLKYERGQKAINYNYLEERKAIVSMPFRGRNFSAFSRLTLNQIVLPTTKYTTAQLLLSGVYLGISTNFTTHSIISASLQPNTYSILSQTFRLPKKLIFTPQVQYSYNQQQITNVRAELEKRIFNRGLFNIAYEKNFQSFSHNIRMGLRFDLSFAQTSFSAQQGNSATSFTQSAKGSLMYDDKFRHIGYGNRSSVGRGGLTICAFLDLNSNGRHDKGEPKVPGLKIRVKSGRVQNNQRDSTIRVFELEPYVNYFIELDRSSFDNIAWRIKSATLNVAIEPNQFKLIEVPIAVMGEASGMVYKKDKDGLKGQERINVNFYKNGRLVGKVLTESDGYFNFASLPMGSYTASVDSDQLKKLHMSVSPQTLSVKISGSTDGDVVEGLNFVISTNPAENSNKIAPSSVPKSKLPVKKVDVEIKTVE